MEKMEEEYLAELMQENYCPIPGKVKKYFEFEYQKLERGDASGPLDRRIYFANHLDV